MVSLLRCKDNPFKSRLGVAERRVKAFLAQCILKLETVVIVMQLALMMHHTARVHKMPTDRHHSRRSLYPGPGIDVYVHCMHA